MINPAQDLTGRTIEMEGGDFQGDFTVRGKVIAPGPIGFTRQGPQIQSWVVEWDDGERSTISAPIVRASLV